MAANAHQIVFRAALEAGSNWTVSDRIILYRSLSEFAGTPSEAQQLNKLAEDLEAAEARHAQLSLQFSLTDNSHNGGTKQ